MRRRQGLVLAVAMVVVWVGGSGWLLAAMVGDGWWHPCVGVGDSNGWWWLVGTHASASGTSVVGGNGWWVGVWMKTELRWKCG